MYNRTIWGTQYGEHGVVSVLYAVEVEVYRCIGCSSEIRNVQCNVVVEIVVVEMVVCKVRAGVGGR